MRLEERAPFDYLLWSGQHEPRTEGGKSKEPQRTNAIPSGLSPVSIVLETLSDLRSTTAM